MNAGTKTGITDELLGGFKTGDIADRGKNGQTKVDAKARYLESESHGIPPLGGIAKGSDVSIELGNQRFEVIEDFKGMAEEDLFGGGEGNGIPPGKVLVRERYARGKLEHVAMKETVKAVACHGLDPDQAAAMCKEAAGFTDVDGWNPHLGDETGGAELGELDGVEFVGLDAGKSDPGEFAGVGDFDPRDEADDAVVEIPGIGGGFDGEDVGGEEMVASPVGPIFEGYLEWFEDDFLEGVDGGDEEEMLARPGGLGQGGDQRRRTE
jgi:hypothetical protein